MRLAKYLHVIKHQNIFSLWGLRYNVLNSEKSFFFQNLLAGYRFVNSGANLAILEKSFAVQFLMKRIKCMNVRPVVQQLLFKRKKTIFTSKHSIKRRKNYRLRKRVEYPKKFEDKASQLCWLGQSLRRRPVRSKRKRVSRWFFSFGPSPFKLPTNHDCDVFFICDL